MNEKTICFLLGGMFLAFIEVALLLIIGVLHGIKMIRQLRAASTKIEAITKEEVE